jgi:dephospho-CoA kinase
MKIIAITGMPGSGKGTFEKEIMRIKKIPIIVMREVVEDEMREKGIKVTNRNLRNYATEIRKMHGNDVVAKKCVPIIKGKNSDLLIIDGIRSLDEIDRFKKEFGDDFHLIAVHASPKIRFERLKERGLEWDMEKWDEFVFRDKKELSWGLGSAIAMADHFVVNENSLKHLSDEAKRMINEILGDKN